MVSRVFNGLTIMTKYNLIKAMRKKRIVHSHTRKLKISY
jgi:hypothetical protein